MDLLDVTRIAPTTAGQACPNCTSLRIRPFMPVPTGVEYRCRDCGHRWTMPVTHRNDD